MLASRRNKAVEGAPGTIVLRAGNSSRTVRNCGKNLAGFPMGLGETGFFRAAIADLETNTNLFFRPRAIPL